MAAIRMALMGIRIVMRTRVALFFTFVFPLVFLFIYAGIFARGNPNVVAYFFGPVLVLNIMGSAFWGLGLQSVVQRERGSLRRYRLSPISAGSVVTSNLIANYLLQLPTLVLLVFCAMAIFHMPLRIGVGALVVLVTIGVFSFAGFGLAIASVANTMQEAQLYNNVAWLTLLFLSGTTIPLPDLPRWIQRVAAFLPATYLVNSFQALMVGSASLAAHWVEMLALVVSGVIGLGFAWKLFRWEKEERIPTSGKLWSLALVVPFLLIGLWMNTRANPMPGWAMTFHLADQGPPPGASARTEASKPGAAAHETRGPADSLAGGTQTLVENFESPMATAELARRWILSISRQPTSDAFAKLSVVSPGAAGTGHALRFAGVLTADWHPQTPVRLTGDLGEPPVKGFHGLEFWVRGGFPRLFQIEVIGAEVTGSSEARPGIEFVPTSEWQRIRLPMGGVGSGPARPWKLQITVSGGQGPFSLDLDEIGFY